MAGSPKRKAETTAMLKTLGIAPQDLLSLLMGDAKVTVNGVACRTGSCRMKLALTMASLETQPPLGLHPSC